MLEFYLNFEINEESGESVSQIDFLKKHYHNINSLQSIAFQLFPEKLSKIYLKNISLIDNKQNLTEMLELLTYEEIYAFAERLKLIKDNNNNLTKGKSEYSKELLYQIFLSHFERKNSVLEKINNLCLYPTEKLIWDEHLIPDEYETYNNKILPIPKLNLQFLTSYDYLLRNFKLFRLESTFHIRQDLEEIIDMVSPKFNKRGNFNEFDGWAKMAAPIKNFKILTVKPNEIGKNHPSEVIAEIEINLQGIQSQIKSEWDQVKKHDILFCVHFDKLSSKPFKCLILT